MTIKSRIGALAVWIVVSLFIHVAATKPDCDGYSTPTYRQQDRCLALNVATAVRSWLQEQQNCEEIYPAPSGLAEPLSNSTLQKEFGQLLANSGKTQAYIGVNQSSSATEPSGGWQRVSGPPLSPDMHWKDGEPNDSGGNEDCAWTQEAAGLLALVDIGCGWLGTDTAICQHEVNGISEEEIMITDPARLACLKLNGRFLGSSCFFKTTELSTWDDCWTLLAEKDANARPARIYTNEIFQQLGMLLTTSDQLWTEKNASKARPARIYTDEIFLQLFMLLGPDRVWTGLKAIGGGAAAWMIDALTQDQVNTLSTRPEVLGQSLVTINCGMLKLSGFGDQACTGPESCLGEIVSPFQKYERIMDHTGIESSTSTLATKIVDPFPDERPCAFECQQIEGCLSFTYRPAEGNCTLFAAKSDGISSHLTAYAESGTHFYERNY